MNAWQVWREDKAAVVRQLEAGGAARGAQQRVW